MASNEQIYNKLGELDAKVEILLEQQGKHDERLRSSELQAAKNGFYSGGIVALAIAFIKDTIKLGP